MLIREKIDLPNIKSNLDGIGALWIDRNHRVRKKIEKSISMMVRKDYGVISFNSRSYLFVRWEIACGIMAKLGLTVYTVQEGKNLKLR